jgi:hypothetical protein
MEPLASDHHAVVDDGWIRSLSYDRVTQCLEVRFTWHAVTQFRPLPVVRRIWKARPMTRHLRSDEAGRIGNRDGKNYVSLRVQPTLALPDGQERAGSHQHDSGKEWKGRQAERADTAQ